LLNAFGSGSPSSGSDRSPRCDATGLAQAPSRLVRPPRVAGAPAALECKVVLLLPLKGLDGAPTPSTLVLGQVVGVHIERAFLKDGRFDLVAAGTIARCG
jgi:flavin reductase (DIM6/NTAB) family NADH-FMN oxidoreductase RutF